MVRVWQAGPATGLRVTLRRLRTDLWKSRPCQVVRESARVFGKLAAGRRAALANQSAPTRPRASTRATGRGDRRLSDLVVKLQ
jgi:hypothetical protein